MARTFIFTLLSGLILISCGDPTEGFLEGHRQNHDGVYIQSVDSNSGYTQEFPAVKVKVVNDSGLQNKTTICCTWDYLLGRIEKTYMTVSLQPMQWRIVRMTGEPSHWRIETKCEIER